MRGSRHILVAIVEDDASLCRSLRAAGIQSAEYPSAEAFLADGMKHRFDCLIVDIQLGGMSGIELSQHLAASGSAPPVIFITAHDEPAMRDQALRCGCAAYLKKTDSGQTVLSAIRRAIQ